MRLRISASAWLSALALVLSLFLLPSGRRPLRLRHRSPRSICRMPFRSTPPCRPRRCQRRAAVRPAERPSGQPRVAAAGGQGRIARRGGRSAGARAPHRAHGVQRQRALQAGRAGLVLRVGRRAARAARQRVHQLRRNRLHARPAERQAGDRRERADRAGRFRRRPDARSRQRSTRSAASSSRNGAAASARGSRIRDKQIPVLFYHSRYAERLPIGKPDDHPHRAGGAAARVLRHLVPARARWRSIAVGDIDPAKIEAADHRRRSRR